MLIDLFTTIAQIINFLILVALLKRFLYGPITKAMKNREDTIANRLQEATSAKEAAIQEKETYLQMQQQLLDRKNKLLEDIKAQVEQQRQILLQQAKEEVNIIKSEWYEQIEAEKEDLFQNLRQGIATEITQTTRKALQNLANVSLETQMVEVFLAELSNLEEKEKQAIASSLSLTEEVIFRSTFDLSSAVRQHIMELFKINFSTNVDLHFMTMSDSICGIELITPGYKLTWTIEKYLENLEDKLINLLPQTVNTLS